MMGDTPRVSTRIWGGIKALGGVVEAGAGAIGGAATSWTGIGAVVGGAAVLHGADVTTSGFMEAWTGEDSPTFTQQGINKGLVAVGVSKSNSNIIASGVDGSISIMLTGGAGALRNTTLLPQPPRYFNLASPERTAHILEGDAIGSGGGHSWFGSMKSFVNGITGKKSMFPANWSGQRIMNAISEVTVNNPWIQQTGSPGATMTKAGKPVKYVVEGVYQGTKIRVITTASDIVTAFPIK